MYSMLNLHTAATQVKVDREGPENPFMSQGRSGLAGSPAISRGTCTPSNSIQYWGGFWGCLKLNNGLHDKVKEKTFFVQCKFFYLDYAASLI